MRLEESCYGFLIKSSFTIFKLKRTQKNDNAMSCASMTVYHAYFQKLLSYQGTCQFQIAFTQKKSITSLLSRSLVFTLHSKNGKDSILFSAATMKVSHMGGLWKEILYLLLIEFIFGFT